MGLFGNDGCDTHHYGEQTEDWWDASVSGGFSIGTVGVRALRLQVPVKERCQHHECRAIRTTVVRDNLLLKNVEGVSLEFNEHDTPSDVAQRLRDAADAIEENNE